MKLLISAYSCDPTRGGELSNGWNCVLYNAKLDHQVWCLTNVEGKANIENYLRKNPEKNLQVVYVTVPAWLEKRFEVDTTFSVYPHYLYWQYNALRVAKDLNKTIDFDLVHHATYGSLQLGSHLWKLQKPMIFGPVGGGQRAARAFKRYFQEGWKHEIIRDLMSFLLLNVFKSSAETIRYTDRVLVVNQETYDLAQRYGAQSLFFHRDLLLRDDFFPSVIPHRTATRKLRVLWVGRILPRKGLLLVLEVMAKLDPQLPITLTIIGYGPMESHIPRWLEKLGLEQRVEWVGRKSFSEVQQAYAQHDVFLFGSLRETLAAQVIEAMAYGMPVVTLDHQGNKTFIPDDAAIKIPVTTPEAAVQAMHAAILHLFHNPEERKALGERAYWYAKTFAASRYIQSINEHYEAVLSEPVKV